MTSVPETLFYDGHCGLCHKSVRFVLARDRDGALFRFAPLGGDTFCTAVAESARAGLPDSLVLLANDGALLTRSRAVLHILRRLGGGWGLLASLGGVLPAAWLDAAYDAIARVRHRIFRRPADACPVFPAHLRSRFNS